MEQADLYKLAKRALEDSENGFGKKQIEISNDAIVHLVNISNGDARSLLNALELAVESTPLDSNGLIKIDLQIAEESIQEKAILYDKHGDAHFDTISAFIKSLRGSDPDAALFWLARMLEAGENPRFIFRRMLIAAAEDIGLADPQAIVVVEACAAAFERIGLPEGTYALAQAALYLATTDKSNSVMGFFEAKKIVQQPRLDEVPIHLRDPSRDKSAFGDGVGYTYPHIFKEHWAPQQYLPTALQGEVFWQPTHLGWEGERRLKIMDRRAAQMAAAFESDNENTRSMPIAPSVPQLERWIQRQVDLEEPRLQKLSNELWLGVSWQSNDRVLVLGGSLLWALKPLREVSEGGVSLLGLTQEESSRLSAEIKVLDPIYRPLLMDSGLQSLSKLPLDFQFECVGGRINPHDLESKKIDHIWKAITNKCVSKSKIILLLSLPRSGPVESIFLRDSLEKFTKVENDLIATAITIERESLQIKYNEDLLMNKLRELGWICNVEEWEEHVPLKLTEQLHSRWAAKDTPYFKLLQANLPNKNVESLVRLIGNSLGDIIHQKIIHRKITGTLSLPLS